MFHTWKESDCCGAAIVVYVNYAYQVFVGYGRTRKIAKRRALEHKHRRDSIHEFDLKMDNLGRRQ